MSNYITVTGATGGEDIYLKKSSITVVQLAHLELTVWDKIHNICCLNKDNKIKPIVRTSVSIHDFCYYVNESPAEIIRKLR